MTPMSSGSPSQRFHRRAGDGVGRLRRWEVTLWERLHKKHPETVLWAAVLADALRVIYRSSGAARVRRELAWLTAPRGDYLGDFANLCEANDIDPDDVRRAVLADVAAGKLKAKLEVVC